MATHWLSVYTGSNRGRQGPSGRGAEHDVEADGQHAAEVAEAMTSDVVCVDAGTRLGQLLNVFLTHGISGVPVVEDGAPIGLVSKSDVVRVLSDALDGTRWRTLGTLTAGDLMSPLMFSVTPDTALERAAALMAYEGVHRLPVIADGKLVGLLTSVDVVRWVARSKGFIIPG